MTTMTIAGQTIDRNDEGFFENPEQVIHFMRKEYAEKGTGPTVRVLGKTSGVSVKELYQLFPKGPAKVAAKIAGIPKPRGCI
jgi:TusE/DsrC/DsvC family sulfur relay protein